MPKLLAASLTMAETYMLRDALQILSPDDIEGEQLREQLLCQLESLLEKFNEAAP